MKGGVDSMKLMVLILVLALSLGTPTCLLAGTEAGDLSDKIQTLENQISNLQSQLDELKTQVASQSKEKQELEAKVQKLESEPKGFWKQANKSGEFRLQDALGLDDESKLNIAGEINMRYRQNFDEQGAKPGFELYEVEFFFDSAFNKNASMFVELPIMHSNKPDLGNAWVDFHSEGELAATDSTGIMLGHFMPWFGNYGYDDNQSWIYGGRTTTNTTLVRGTAIDSQIIRDRQIGIAGNLKLGDLLLTQQVFNGAGPYIVSGGADNDTRKDLVSRLQYTLPNELGAVGTGYWYAPKTRGATTNSAGTQYGSGGKTHVRDIQRYVAFFRYPDVMQATVPDLSLGGKPFMLYGEYHRGSFHANRSLNAFNDTQNYQGAWLETNFNIKRDKLVGVLRWDWFDPNADESQDLDDIWGITPAIKWQFLNQMYLTASFELYEGKDSAAGKDDDRFTLELSSQF